MIVMSSIVALVVGWIHYVVFAELGVSQAVEAFADKPLFSTVTVFLIAAPFCMIRRKPGWSGYLLGSFSGLILAAYFVFRAVRQFMSWHQGLPLAYPLIGAVFALPFVLLFVVFVFSRANRRFHGIMAHRFEAQTNLPRDGE
jgi:hypothetical protein